MREIKFRFWYIPLRRMIDWKYAKYMKMTALDNEEYIPMQFTGLYDSTKWEELTESEREAWVMDGNMPSEWKGKEIYESDILEFSIENCMQANFYLVNDLRELYYELHQDDSYYRFDTDSLKIVGNKFENPDLLEVK